MTGVDDIINAEKQISPYINFQPLIYSSYFSEKFNSKIFFKPENLQVTGSFKIRGALNKILSLNESEKKSGIITASSGNHALGVAFGAKLTGTKAVVVMPENAQKAKIEGVKILGADVVLFGQTPVERYEKVFQLQNEFGYTLIHSCDDSKVIAGQGTIGLEIMKDLNNADSVIVPLGAGALLAGIACAVKNYNPKIRVIGVEPDAIPRFTVSRKANKPQDVPYNPTIADGLRMTRTYPQLYEMIEKYVDEIISVSEEFIKQAAREVILNGRLVVEPSGSIGLAAILSCRLKLKMRRKNVIVLSGGNIDPVILCRLISNQ